MSEFAGIEPASLSDLGETNWTLINNSHIPNPNNEDDVNVFNNYTN